MRAPIILATAVALSMTAAPVLAQSFLGRLAQSTAESAARGLVNGAVNNATRPRPATPPAARNAAPETTPPRAGTQAPAQAAQAQPTQAGPATSAVSGATITIRPDMPVVTSDGVQVAKTIHVIGAEETYAGDHSFFTTDTTYRLRRIYPREATVRGNVVHLHMTRAQYLARSQNPEYFPG